MEAWVSQSPVKPDIAWLSNGNKDPSPISLEGLLWRSHGLVTWKVLCELRNTRIRQGLGQSRPDCDCSEWSASQLRDAVGKELTNSSAWRLPHPRGGDWIPLGPDPCIHHSKGRLWKILRPQLLSSILRAPWAPRMFVFQFANRSIQRVVKIKHVTSSALSLASWRTWYWQVWQIFGKFEFGS